MPRIKVSEANEKITNPDLKKVYRVYGQRGKAIADLIYISQITADTVQYLSVVNYS